MHAECWKLLLFCLLFLSFSEDVTEEGGWGRGEGGERGKSRFPLERHFSMTSSPIQSSQNTMASVKRRGTLTSQKQLSLPVRPPGLDSETMRPQKQKPSPLRQRYGNKNTSEKQRNKEKQEQQELYNSARQAERAAASPPGHELESARHYGRGYVYI